MVTHPHYSLFPWMMRSLFYSSFLLFSFSCFSRKNQASEIEFNTLDVSSQLSLSSTCNRASKAAGLKNWASPSTLEVVHRHGPCAPKWDSKQGLTLGDILMKDQLRVQSIQARGVAANPNKAAVPAQSGDSFGTDDFVVTIGLGTPKKSLTLIFDTGSDVTWTQCQPCIRGGCYRQSEPIFNPSASTTYSNNFSCISHECSELDTHSCHRESNKCLYDVEYGDGSYTSGSYSSDTLTLTPTDVFRNFRFGCGQNNSRLFEKVAGILGLGTSPVSFVSQTANKYAKIFSYCLPPDTRSTGFLRFGEYNDKNNKAKMVFTPFAPAPPPRLGYPPSTYYSIEITDISVGETQLPINKLVFMTAGAMIDSGTVITRLPPAAYKLMSKEFTKQMTKVFKYNIAPAFSILDTCFHITNIAKAPTMSFTFKGDATLHLDPSGILYVINSTLACLAFAGNNNPTNIAIFGNTQQKNLEVMYDVAGNKLGFRPNPNCH